MLHDLGGQLNKVLLHIGTREPWVSNLAKQTMQSMAKFMEQQHPTTWRTDARIQNGEFAVFQQVYAELFKDINDAAPKVGDLSKLIPESDTT